MYFTLPNQRTKHKKAHLNTDHVSRSIAVCARSGTRNQCRYQPGPNERMRTVCVIRVLFLPNTNDMYDKRTALSN